MKKNNSKNLKRTIRFIAITLMVESLLLLQLFIPFSISANSPVFSLLPSKTTLNRLDTVTVSVKVEKTDLLSSGLDGYSGTFKYDPAIFSFIEATNKIAGWAFSTTPASGQVTFVGYDDSPPSLAQKADVVVFEVKLQVLAGATYGNTTLQINKGAVSDAHFNEQDTQNVSLSLNIQEKQTPTKSSNNRLSSLQLKEATLSPSFNETTLVYTATVNNSVTQVTLEGTLSDSNAKIVSGMGRHEIKEGNNRLEIVVQAEDGSVRTYSVDVVRERASTPPIERSNSNLSNLILKDGNKTLQLNPAFSKDVKEYSIETTAKTIQIDGSTVDNQSRIVSGVGNHDLKEGLNRVEVIVEGEDGTRSTYVLNITRASQPIENVPPTVPGDSETPTVPVVNVSTNNYINLISGVNLSPLFSKDVTSYTAHVGRETLNLNLTIVPEDKDARIIVEGADSLSIGKNVVRIRVIAPNGEERIIEIEVYRSEEESQAVLSALTVGGYPMNPGFKEDVYFYNMSVDNDVSNLAISATPKYGNTRVSFGSNQKLISGLNYIKVHVNGENGMMNTYVVEVFKEASPSKEWSIHPAYIWAAVASFWCLALLVVFLATRHKPQPYIVYTQPQEVRGKE